jgi:hypothetical protein
MSNICARGAGQWIGAFLARMFTTEEKKEANKKLF